MYKLLSSSLLSSSLSDLKGEKKKLQIKLVPIDRYVPIPPIPKFIHQMTNFKEHVRKCFHEMVHDAQAVTGLFNSIPTTPTSVSKSFCHA